MSTESAGAPGPARVRASDGEREEYARIVRDAVGEGRLSLDEGDERLANIYAAKFRDELRPAIADLPQEDPGYGRGPRPGGPDGPRPGGPPRGPRRGPDAERGRDWRDREWSGREWRGAGQRGFTRHVGFVAVVAAVLVTIWALTSSGFFWPLIPLAFLAFGLFRHACWLGWRRRWYSGQGPR